MKVILIKELKGKGKPGDIIDVNPNYAMNVLVRQGIAKEATASNLNDHKGQVEAKAFHHGELVKSYQEIANKIKNKTHFRRKLWTLTLQEHLVRHFVWVSEL